jgi:hypothetical protein
MKQQATSPERQRRMLQPVAGAPGLAEEVSHETG